MSFVALSRFTIANGMAHEVKEAFRSRPGYVNSAPGFVRMDVISPVSNTDEIWLITYWTDQLSYETWHRSDAHRESHKFIPKGLKVVPGSTKVEYYEHVSS
jgi:heme-degrading monooxygenase HmoA